MASVYCNASRSIMFEHCVMNAGHDGQHMNTRGERWSDAPKPPPSAIEQAAVEYVRQFKRLDVDPSAVRGVDAAHVALWGAVLASHPELKP